MTVQLSNSVLYERGEYALASSHGGRLFEPAQFGIETEMLHTACYRGFLCTYETTKRGFFLFSLEIRSKHGLYPLINETPPSFPNGFYEGIACKARYDDIGFRMAYTGTLRFDRDLDWKWQIYGLALKPWMYHRVFEAEIADGYVEYLRDISGEVAEIRNQHGDAKAWYENQRKLLREELDEMCSQNSADQNASDDCNGNKTGPEDTS